MSALPSRGPLTQPHAAATSECVVVGGGLIGLFAADALQRRGLQVTVLERGGAGGGASRGNAGEIVPALVAPLSAPGTVSDGLGMFLRPDSAFFVHPMMSPQIMAFLLSFAKHCRPRPYADGLQLLQQFAARTFDLYTDLENRLKATGSDPHINRAGYLYVHQSEQTARAGRADYASRGLETTAILDHDRLLEQDANLGPEAVAGFVAKPLWSVDPDRLVDLLAAQLTDAGVRLQENTEVLDVVSHPGHVEVVTTNGTYSAERVVIAAGVWSRSLCRRLGVKLPLVPGKGYSFEVDLHHPLRRVIQFQDVHVVATPITNGVRIAGTMEFDRTIDGLNLARVKSIVRAVGDSLIAVDWEDRRNEWVGPRPMSGDGLPTIGPVPNAPNVFIAAGHNMHGLSLGPVTGELVADLVCGVTRRTLFPVQRARRRPVREPRLRAAT